MCFVIFLIFSIHFEGFCYILPWAGGRRRRRRRRQRRRRRKNSPNSQGPIPPARAGEKYPVRAYPSLRQAPQDAPTYSRITRSSSNLPSPTTKILQDIYDVCYVHDVPKITKLGPTWPQLGAYFGEVGANSSRLVSSRLDSSRLDSSRLVSSRLISSRLVK